MIDLPPGKYTAALIGPWWPPDPAPLATAAQHWAAASAQRSADAAALTRRRDSLTVNEGITATHILEQYKRGINKLLDHAEKYKVKERATTSVHGAGMQLRETLTRIAEDGNRRIEEILSSKKPGMQKLVEVLEVQAESHASAANASRNAVQTVIDATQKVLDVGIGGDARAFLREQGASLDDPEKPAPLTEADIGDAQHAPDTGAGAQASAVGDSQHSPGPIGDETQGTNPAVGDGQRLPGDPGRSPAGAGIPATGVPMDARVPGGGGALSPAAALGGGGLSPESLGQSFTQGMTAGQPAAAGAQALSSGTVQAVESASAPPPAQAAPAAAPLAGMAPTVPGGGVSMGESAAVDHGPAPVQAAPAAPVASVGPAPMVAAPFAPPPMAAGPVAPPVAGPLPAYGADLRPPIVAPPPVAGPPAPLGGSPVAPSAATSPTAGGSVVSPIGKAGAAVGAQAGGSAAVVGGAVASAAAGAAAGEVERQAAEKQRLQRIVDAVARQERGLAWAAGLRADGTTLLVTDLACGWIPPHIELPAGVRLLEPGVRREDMSAVDLLGAVTVTASHMPLGYVADAGEGAAALTGERARYGHVIDELGPIFGEVVSRRDALPRCAQTLGQSAIRGTGLNENEIDVLRERGGELRAEVLRRYPSRVRAAVDWALVATVESLIDGSRELAQYHLAWAKMLASSDVWLSE